LSQAIFDVTEIVVVPRRGRVSVDQVLPYHGFALLMPVSAFPGHAARNCRVI
jgi:hypothetical protein